MLSYTLLFVVQFNRNTNGAKCGELTLKNVKTKLTAKRDGLRLHFVADITELCGHSCMQRSCIPFTVSPVQPLLEEIYMVKIYPACQIDCQLVASGLWYQQNLWQKALEEALHSKVAYQQQTVVNSPSYSILELQKLSLKRGLDMDKYLTPPTFDTNISAKLNNFQKYFSM